MTGITFRPGEQSAGVSRELLARTFPASGPIRRAIIASLDSRAQACYLKAGVYPTFPIYISGARLKRPVCPARSRRLPRRVSPC